MKKKPVWIRCAIALFLTTILPACGPAPAPEAENLAPNPSFEEGEAGAVTGWEGDVSNITFTWREDTAYRGGHSICMEDLPSDSGGDWVTREPIPVTPGLTYALRAHVRGDFDREVYIMITPTDAEGNRLAGTAMDATFDNTDWTLVMVPLTARSSTVSVTLHLGVNNSTDEAATGRICFDEVSFRQEPLRP